MSDWIEIGQASDFADGQVAAAVAGGQALAVFRLGEELFALKDLCTHGNARLSDGYVEDGCVECPLHQGLFDIRSGAPRCAPVTEAVRSFPVRVVAGRVQVAMAAGTPPDAPPPAHALRATVETIARPAPDVAVLRLRCADGALSYKAGQYVDVLLDDGARRSYSMATPASGNGALELHIRHLPGGLFTDRVFGALRAGDALTLEGPGGDFHLRDGDAPVVLLASGTGFAPVKAIVEQAIADGQRRPMRLYWGGRTQADLYMDALCRRWCDELAWFDYVPVLSAAPQDWSGRTGLVHLAVMHDLPDLRGHEVYACGAPVVVAAARDDFTRTCGLPAAAFHADAFVSQADRRP